MTQDEALAELKVLLEYVEKSPNGWIGEAYDICGCLVSWFELRRIDNLPTPSKDGKTLWRELDNFLKIRWEAQTDER